MKLTPLSYHPLTARQVCGSLTCFNVGVRYKVAVKQGTFCAPSMYVCRTCGDALRGEQ